MEKMKSNIVIEFLIGHCQFLEYNTKEIIFWKIVCNLQPTKSWEWFTIRHWTQSHHMKKYIISTLSKSNHRYRLIFQKGSPDELL